MVEALHDFIVVGSGAGGGPLAANLVEAGFSVLMIEAGGDHRCPYYDVPIMQARASEDAEMRWDYFVRHYADDTQQKRDDKFVSARNGVLYPRGATLGGSTAISAPSCAILPRSRGWNPRRPAPSCANGWPAKFPPMSSWMKATTISRSAIRRNMSAKARTNTTTMPASATITRMARTGKPARPAASP